MAELRTVDPRTLRFNPNNPRRTPAPPAMEEQLIASIRAIGLIQPPCVTADGGTLTIVAGNRRVKAAIAAELPVIDVLLCDADEAADAMRAVAENMVRVAMSSVDTWRAIERLEAQGWNEPAIADALALPLRTVRRLKLLAHLHPPMLDAMAQGTMPNEEQLRTIAAAAREEQAQVWKKHRPRKGETEVVWWEIARALAKRRIPAAAARFDDDLAKAHGVVWEEDLFAPPGEDGRTTTNVQGFFGAQQEWLAHNLPARGVLLALDEYGNPQLPKKAERVFGKPGKADSIGCYVDARSGEVEMIAYRMPAPKQAGKAAAAVAAPQPRPDITRKGVVMIGDLRTDALHQALAEAPIEDDTLLALLVLALGGDNVTVMSGSGMGGDDRAAICQAITAGGALTGDLDALRQAARRMLTCVLSCRENRSQSGLFARIAGEAIGASLRLPSMATEEFLACLSRGALERAARAEKVRVEPRAKDTRGRMLQRFKDKAYIHPAALFRLTPDECATLAEPRAEAEPGEAESDDTLTDDALADDRAGEPDERAA